MTVFTPMPAPSDTTITAERRGARAIERIECLITKSLVPGNVFKTAMVRLKPDATSGFETASNH